MDETTSATSSRETEPNTTFVVYSSNYIEYHCPGLSGAALLVLRRSMLLSTVSSPIASFKIHRGECPGLELLSQYRIASRSIFWISKPQFPLWLLQIALPVSQR